MLLILKANGGTKRDTSGESFDVKLSKNAQGLGITIAGYVGDKNAGKYILQCNFSLQWLPDLAV